MLALDGEPTYCQVYPTTLYAGEFAVNMALKVSFVQRGSAVDVKEIDKTVKNKWNWNWCDKVLFEGSPDQHLIGDCFRKLHQAGDAFCECCRVTIKYGSSGLG